MIDRLIDGLTESGKRDTENLEAVKLQLDAIRSTHDALKEYVFQSLLNIRSNENTQEKLELAVSTLIEIKKYSSQEIERYSNALSLLSGKIQCVQETIAQIDSMSNSDNNDREDENGNTHENKAQGEVDTP